MKITKAKYIEETLNWVSIEFEDGTKGQSSLTDGIRRQYTDLLDEWIKDGGIVEEQYTAEELLQQIEDAKPKVVTMRQARLALLQGGLLQTVTDAIANGTDEAMKVEWEYATEVKRDWDSLIALTTALGMTSQELDDLFMLASTL